MEATVVGLRLASGVVVPLIRRLVRPPEPGAGLVDQPVRLGRLLTFTHRGQVLGDRQLGRLTEELVRRAARAAGPHDAPPEEDLAAVSVAVLHAVGNLTRIRASTDVDLVTAGPERLARQLAHYGDGLPASCEAFYENVLRTVCLHLVDHLTRRSTFVARTLVEQSRRLERLVRAVDLLVERVPSQSAADLRFEETYARHIVRRHGELTIHGIDLDERWPLDDAYLSLRATERETLLVPEGERFRIAQTAAPPQRAEQALADHERVLLRGVAGSGKTTLVQWLAVITAEQRVGEGLFQLLGRVPFVLPLRTLTRRGRRLPPPAEFLSAVGCPHTPPEGWVERVLTAGRGLLLIDGVDEVPEDERADARAWVRELLGEFPGNVWLVTARPSAVRADWLTRDGFTDLTLSPMGPEDVAAFVERWHRAAGAGEDRGRALLDAVRVRPDLARLATNPLMCGLMCALHHTRHGYLPRGREALYDAALRMLLEQRDAERKVRSPVELDAVTQTSLLRRLAYWLIRNGRSELEREDAVELLDAARTVMPQVAAVGDAARVYAHLLDRSGLLIEPADGAVQFIHRTFQDYLGAKEAVESRDIPLLVRHAHLDQWEDVIRMAVAHGRREERARLLKQLVTRGDRVKRHRLRLHLLAVACLEHATELDPEIRELVLDRASGYLPPRTVEEANALAAAGSIVLELLPGPDGLTAHEALSVIDAAAAIGSDAALPVLRRHRDRDTDVVRQRLASYWDRFDTDRYFAEVISHLPAEETIFRAAAEAQLLRLAELRGLARLRAARPLGMASIVEVLGHQPLTDLKLDRIPVPDLAVLHAWPELARLYLDELSDVGGLAPLTELSALRALVLTPGALARTPGGLDRLSSLTTLVLGVRTLLPSLDALPRQAPLDTLYLPRDAPELTGVEERWPGLTHLSLAHLRRGLTPLEWRSVAGLTELAWCTLSPPVLGSLAGAAESLTSVRTLSLLGTEDTLHSADDVAAVAAAFPALRSLTLSAPAADLAPLAGLPDLRSVHFACPAMPVNCPDHIEVTHLFPSRY